MRFVSRFLRDDRGATAIEYAVIAAGIGVVLITAVAGLGNTLNTTFKSVSDQVAGLGQ